MNTTRLFALALLFSLCVPLYGYAAELPFVRVFYRPDGSVAVTHFVAETCVTTETVTQCMNRITQTLGDLSQMPYDDLRPNQLPQGRENRDEWRGQKGRGVWVDESLVTKQEQVDELQGTLDAEIAKENPDPTAVIKLQHAIEEVQDIDRKTLTSADVQKFGDLTDSQPAGLASVIMGVGEFFGGIVSQLQNSVLALASLVTNTLKVGSTEAPAGITVYDQATGNPYCLVVVNGQMQNISGECGVPIAPVDETPDETPPEGTGGDTPPEETPPVEPPAVPEVPSEPNVETPLVEEEPAPEEPADVPEEPEEQSTPEESPITP